MISKISKLKDFGIFHDFTWKTELSDFKRFNLIYGWNRSGKTTISRVFASCEKKCTYDKDKFEQYPATFDESGNFVSEGEFEIKTDNGTTVKNPDVATNNLLIKVFNQDFIKKNISFDSSNYCNSIVYVSEKDIETKEKLVSLKNQIQPLADKCQELKILREGTQKIEDNFRISLAQTITQLLTDKTKRDRYYSYDKSKVKEKVDEIGIDNFFDKVLPDNDKKKYEVISKSEPEKNQIALPRLTSVNFTYLFTRVKSLLGKKVVSELLERLKDPEDKDGGLDEELNNWVKQGFDIHKTKNQFKKCLFCENDLNNNFFDSLAKHFSKDYEDLQSFIEFLIKDLKKEIAVNISEKNVELYSDLRNGYENKAKEYNEIVKKQNDWLNQSETWLEQKYKNPFDSDIPEMVATPEDYTNLLNKIIDELNEIISKHNLRVKNHNTEVVSAREKLELHSIAVALSEQNYKKMGDEVKEAEKKEKGALEAINKNNFEISELEKQTSDIVRAIKDINKHLEEFFGRQEIELGLGGDKKGYIIKRDGQPAKNLSEGEKTAIAFSYFIIKVGEGDFDKSKGIIFIDDPISSFDSNFIYHCFSLIKNHFNEVGQLFISTHNFQLFNLAKDWFVRKNKNIEEDNKDRKIKGKQEKESSCEFYMIKPSVNKNPRESKFVVLDSTLRNYKSEYSFLFSLLNDFNKKTEEPTFEEIYNIANIGRRFFDIFADFKIPTNEKEQKEKIDIIVDEINKRKQDEDKISKVSCDKIFWLINGFSHNSDPTSTIEHKDKSESKDAIKILLNIVKESDPKHFEILEKNLV